MPRCRLTKLKRDNDKGEYMNWYLEALKKYAVFSGRARRKEFWYFFLVNIIASILLMAIDAFTGSFNANVGMGLLGGIYTLAVLIPNIAVSVRRLHDTGHKGWWLLICLVPLIGVIVLLIFMVQDSDFGENRFGSNPKKGDHADSKGLDEDAYMERILREADARARGEARRRATYPISEVTQPNEEFIALLKSALNENKFETISNEDLLEIFQRARSIAAFSNTMDIELSKAINTLVEEIKKRGLSQEKSPQKIPNYRNSSFTKNKAGGISKWVYTIPVIAIALVVIIYFDKEKAGRNEAAMTESSYSLKETQEVDERWKESQRVFFTENPEYFNEKAKKFAFVEAVNRLLETEESKKMTDAQVFEAAKKECDAIFYPTGRPKAGGNKVDAVNRSIPVPAPAPAPAVEAPAASTPQYQSQQNSPDTSNLSSEEKSALFRACYAAQGQGIVSYNQCVRQQLSMMGR